MPSWWESEPEGGSWEKGIWIESVLEPAFISRWEAWIAPSSLTFLPVRDALATVHVIFPPAHGDRRRWGVQRFFRSCVTDELDSMGCWYSRMESFLQRTSGAEGLNWVWGIRCLVIWFPGEKWQRRLPRTCLNPWVGSFSLKICMKILYENYENLLLYRSQKNMIPTPLVPPPRM